MPDIHWPNTFRQRLRSRERLIGCWASLASPICAEVLGYAGFDWLLIDGEHAPNDLQTAYLQLMALKDSASAPVIRPQSVDTVLIKRYLDLGFCNFLMPFIESAEQAQAAVAATRYPPAGIRGVAILHRGNQYGARADYFEIINQNIGIMVQIESPLAVQNVDAIAAVEGVDGLFIGPQDLAATHGHLIRPSHPEVQAAIATVLAAGKRQGKPVGILAPIAADAERYLEQGLELVAVGSDVGLLREASKASAARFLNFKNRG
jgi:2-dehydro-3-deoxyglucarate aldolase